MALTSDFFFRVLTYAFSLEGRNLLGEVGEDVEYGLELEISLWGHE